MGASEALTLAGRDGALRAIPGVAAEGAAYDYATDNAFVVLPPRCVASLGLRPNAAGARSEARIYWVGRLGELPRRGNAHARVSKKKKEEVRLIPIFVYESSVCCQKEMLVRMLETCSWASVRAAGSCTRTGRVASCTITGGTRSISRPRGTACSRPIVPRNRRPARAVVFPKRSLLSRVEDARRERETTSQAWRTERSVRARPRAEAGVWLCRCSRRTSTRTGATIWCTRRPALRSTKTRAGRIVTRPTRPRSRGSRGAGPPTTPECTSCAGVRASRETGAERTWTLSRETNRENLRKNERRDRRRVGAMRGSAGVGRRPATGANLRVGQTPAGGAPTSQNRRERCAILVGV